MPLPEPRENEPKDEFMRRCMGDEVAQREFPDEKQRVAVCYAQWRKHHPEDKPPEDSTEEKPRGLAALSPLSMPCLWAVAPSFDPGRWCPDLPAQVTLEALERNLQSIWQSNGYKQDAAGIAIIEVVGLLLKYGGELFGGTATVRLAEAVRRAARDPAVRGLLLLIDSPGGMTAGLGDMLDAIDEARQKKPVWAYISDTGCSGAYQIAAATDRIWAHAMALVGGLGTYAVVRDFSEALKRIGIQTYVVRSGELKGLGTLGAAISEAELADLKRLVEEVNLEALRRVAAGRGRSLADIQALADGRVYTGPEALKRFLVDALGTLDQCLLSLATVCNEGEQKGKVMSESEQQVESPKAVGGPGVPETPTSGVTVFDDFVAAARSYATEHGCSLREAMRALARAYPEAHRDWVLAQKA